jgi:hypothetical protein
MNSPAQHEMMKLVLSWTLIGALILTVIVTLLSLAGFLRFSGDEQRNKLIYILLAQLVIVGITFPLGIFQPAPGAAVKRIEQASRQAAEKLEQVNRILLEEQDRLNGELGKATRQLAESREKTAAYAQQIARANENAEAQSKTIARMQNFAQRAPSEQTIANSEEMSALRTRAERAEAELAESRQLEETMRQKLKDSDSKFSALEQSRREKARQLQRANVMGRVLAVNPGWNFVVLSIGDKQGVTPDSTLLVIRGGAQIAKVRVKTIEPTQSIADVITSSVRRGATVKPGDNVVFEEIRTQPTQASQPAASRVGVPLDPALPPLPALTH